jgi:GT2 family glycosyltransferase
VFVTLDADVLVDAAFLPPLLERFESEGDTLFAVTALIEGYPPGSPPENPEATGVAWRYGMLRTEGNRREGRPSRVLYNCGCATAFDRRKYLELGGFDPLYFPLYFEDIDLSWRAWKRGWLCLHEGASVVYHDSGSALGRDVAVSALVCRNEFLFHWVNLDRRSLSRHLVFLAPRLFAALVRRDRSRVNGFREAVNRLGQVRASRKRAQRQALLDDRTALRAVNSQSP